ncbi:MAG: DUF2231 domain-containing protein [Alicyclobacillus sp.]|nr:DUF2231 domain-containing protein [Alicyclobacillus sp.]
MAALEHLFPPTIHPMVVHFSIAAVYFSALAGAAGLLFRQPFYARSFMLLVWLSILATVVTGLAGVISESYVYASAQVQPVLHSHKMYGEITGVLLLTSAFLQWRAPNRHERVSWPAFAVCLAAVVTISLAGYLGGSMVYEYGLGVHGHGR